MTENSKPGQPGTNKKFRYHITSFVDDIFIVVEPLTYDVNNDVACGNYAAQWRTLVTEALGRFGLKLAANNR